MEDEFLDSFMEDQISGPEPLDDLAEWELNQLANDHEGENTQDEADYFEEWFPQD